MSEWKTAGKVRMTPKGQWDSTLTYTILDTVYNEDVTIYYVAKKDVPAGTLLTNTEYWDVVVSVDDAATHVEDTIDSFEANLIKAQATQPIETENRVWIDTNVNEVTVPEIDDESVSTVDTWSSSKINDEVEDLKSAIAEKQDTLTDNSITPNLIEGRKNFVNNVEFTDYIRSDNKRIYATGTALVEYGAEGIFNTGKIPLSAFDGIDTVNVKFAQFDSSFSSPQVCCIEKVSGSTAGWARSNLPSSFISSVDDYYVVDISYLRAKTGTEAIAYIGINFDNNYIFEYQQSESLTNKELEWLTLTAKNGHVPIIVDTNGNGDFTSIQDAVNFANDFDTIIINPGSYQESVDVPANKYLHIIGSGTENTILFNTLGDYSHPPLWCCKGIIENLTIYNKRLDNVDYSSVTRLGYAIHLDQRWGNTNKTITLINCKIISDFSTAIGCGVNDGCSVTLINCEINSTGKSSNLASAFQIHGDNTTEGTCSIAIENSVFRVAPTSNGTGFLLSNGGTNTGTRFKCRFNNNRIKRFYNNCGDLFILDDDSFGNDIEALNGEAGQAG